MLLDTLPAPELMGYAAAALTTFSFAPQAWLTYRTKDVSGVSLSMYSVFTLGVVLWLLYGLAVGAWPVVLANAITLLLALAILAMKLRYGRYRLSGFLGLLGRLGGRRQP